MIRESRYVNVVLLIVVLILTLTKDGIIEKLLQRCTETCFKFELLLQNRL